MGFRWNEWNLDHVTKHGISTVDAEYVVLNAVRPYPLRREDEKWLVWGPTPAARLAQVVFVTDEDDSIYIIHARPLTRAEMRTFRRRKR